MPDDGARRSSRAIWSLSEPALLAQLDLAELEVAQLGDRLLAHLRGQPHQLDLDLGDLAAVLGDRGLDLAGGALQPRQLALRRQHPGHLGQALAQQRLLRAISLPISGRSGRWSRRQRLEALVLLGDLGLLLARAAPPPRPAACGGRRTAAAGRASARRSSGRPARGDELGVEGDRVERRRARRRDRLLRARISNHWPSTVSSSGPRSSPSSSTSIAPSTTSSPSRALIASITPPVGCWITWRLPSTSSAPALTTAPAILVTAAQAPRPKTRVKTREVADEQQRAHAPAVLRRRGGVGADHPWASRAPRLRRRRSWPMPPATWA